MYELNGEINNMNKYMLKLSKISLNINQLKIIAIVTMIIDHIGYYFEPYLNDVIYYILRAIGRISMPIFAYMLVQGFFHTSNLKKYIFRIFSFAIVTQLAIFIVSIFDNDSSRLVVNTQLNILFSYTLSLIVLWLIHEKNVINKWNYNKNMLLKILMLFLILAIFLFIPFDYGIYVPLFVVMLYLIEKLKITIYLNKQSYTVNMKNIVTAFIPEDKIKIGYILLIAIAMLTIIARSLNPMYWYMLLSLPIIYLYNGEKGKNDNKLKYLFYAVFPLQHILLYFLSLIL